MKIKKRLTLFLGTLVILGALLACGGSDTNTGTAANSDTQTKNTPAPAQQHFKIGQTVKIGSTFQQTINSAKVSDGDDMNHPKAGTHYLLVDVSITNVSQKEQEISSMAMWDLRDSTGQQYTESITSFTKPPDGKLEPGSPLRGVIAYEVPTGMHAFTLAFQADMLSAGQTTWDISV